MAEQGHGVAARVVARLIAPAAACFCPLPLDPQAAHNSPIATAPRRERFRAGSFGMRVRKCSVPPALPGALLPSFLGPAAYSGPADLPIGMTLDLSGFPRL